MGVYRTVCYKVEDVFVRVLSRKQDSETITMKVMDYRGSKEAQKARKKEKAQQRAAVAQQQKERKKEQEHQEVLGLIAKVMNLNKNDYTKYEYNEIKRNKSFFTNLVATVYEPGEYGFCFLKCEFDMSKTKELKGYLIVTNKRVWFISNDFRTQQKFRYQTIKDVNWFKDGMLEKGLKIQYGTKKLEFDEIFDEKQMQRVASKIKQAL
ncbi:PH domain-containing protein (plasmid) [Pseudalkalibacillus hwajinpoensis]|uniref:PH domain-containing protein n=1 Tax=Guptibacillus hwajinpoensis TaxID=208199 RepID=UPI00325AC93B